MKKIRRLLSCLLVLTLSAASLAACGTGGNSSPASDTGEVVAGSSEPSAGTAPASGEKISFRVSWWGAESRHKATLAAMERYMELHPEIQLVGEYSDWGGHYDKLVTQIAGGTAPDIMQINDRWYFDFTKKQNVVVDMNTLGDHLDLELFDQSFLEDYCSYDGVLLGLPLGVTGVGILYNKDFFAEHNIPEDTVWTWDNLLEIGQRVHAENPDHYLYVCEPPEMWSLQKVYVKQRIGGQLIEEDGTLNVTPELFAEAFAYGKQMLDLGVTEPFETAILYTDVSNENPKWIGGELGMQLKYITHFKRYQDGLDINYGVSNSPVFDGMLDSGVTVSTGNLFGINNKCANVEEAAKFINWFVTDEEAIKLLGEERSSQPTEKGRELLTEAGLSDPLVTEAVGIALENASKIVDNGISQTQEFEANWQDFIEQVAFGKLTPEDAGQQMVDATLIMIEESLAKS